MNYVKTVVALLTFVVVPSLGSSNCEQTFRFLALNWQASRTFWIAENLSGECHSSQIIQVILSDSVYTTAYTHLKEPNDWSPIDSAIAHVRTENPIICGSQDGAWIERKSLLTITPPLPDSALLESFWRHIAEGGDNGADWNRKHGLRGITLPNIRGMKASLAYYYPAGLYIAYTISSEYYFPDAGYILIFTQQTRRAVGNDTMHGFLIFRVEE